MGKSPPRKSFMVGEEVQALYRNGVWYPGKIDAILGPNEYRIAWQDGDPNEQQKISEHIRRAKVFDEGELVECLFRNGKWYEAAIERVEGPDMYIVAWKDGDQVDKCHRRRLDVIRQWTSCGCLSSLRQELPGGQFAHPRLY